MILIFSVCLNLTLTSVPFGFCYMAEPYHIDYQVLYFQAERESKFKVSAVGKYKTSSHGLMQLTKSTARKVCELTGKKIYDPYKNLECAIWYMYILLVEYNWDYYTALAAYNQGDTSVNRNGICRASGNYAEEILENAGYIIE